MDLLFSKLKQGLLHNKFKIRLPAWYLVGLLVSLIVFLLHIPFNALETCMLWQGTKVCSPIGSMIAVFLSLPGYLFGGLLPESIVDSYWIISFLIVISISIVFYGLIGTYIDYLRTKNKQTKMKVGFVSIFLVMVLITFVLLLRTM